MSIGGRGRYCASMWNGGGGRCPLRGGDRLGDLRHVQKDWLGMLIAIHEWVDETVCSSFRLLVYHWYRHRYSQRASKAHKQFLNEYSRNSVHVMPYLRTKIAISPRSLAAYGRILSGDIKSQDRRLKRTAGRFHSSSLLRPFTSPEPSHLPLILMQRL